MPQRPTFVPAAPGDGRRLGLRAEVGRPCPQVARHRPTLPPRWVSGAIFEQLYRKSDQDRFRNLIASASPQGHPSYDPRRTHTGRLVGQGAGPAHDADLARGVDVARHDADLALASGASAVASPGARCNTRFRSPRSPGGRRMSDRSGTRQQVGAQRSAFSLRR